MVGSATKLDTSDSAELLIIDPRDNTSALLQSSCEGAILTPGTTQPSTWITISVHWERVVVWKQAFSPFRLLCLASVALTNPGLIVTLHRETEN